MTDSQPNNQQQPWRPEQQSQPAAEPTPTTPIPQYDEHADAQTAPAGQAAPAAPQQPAAAPIPQYGQYAPQTPTGQPAQPTYGQYAPAQPQPGYQQAGPQPRQPEYGQYAPQQPQPEYGQYAPQGQQPPVNPFAQGYQPAPGQPLPQGAPQYAYAAEPPIDQPWYGIGFGAAINRLFRKAFVWTGRASRGEFWWAYLFTVLVNVGVTSIGGLLGWFGLAIGYVWAIASAVLLLFVGIRRLHDTNRSGWFMLFYVIPWAIDKIINAAIARPLSNMFATELNHASAMGDTADLEFMLERFLMANSDDIGIVMATAAIDLISTIVMLVLLVARSNPAGARFDVAAQQPQQPGAPQSGPQQPNAPQPPQPQNPNPFAPQQQ